MNTTMLQSISTPFVYLRRDIPEDYIEKIKKYYSTVIVEPWVWNHPEPEPTVDLTNCDVILTLGMRDEMKIIKQAPNVRWIHSLSVGVEAMLHKDIRDSDIIVTNSKGCTSIPIAEHVLAMITSFARGIPTMLRNEVERKWELIPVIDLADVTVGIIGYGEIGHEIAKRCKVLGMKVIGCRRNPKAEGEDNIADLVVGIDEVDMVLNQSDFVVLALPSTEETHHFLNKERMNEMKQGSYLINVGRGNAIVDDDLIEALEANHIAGASLDVFEVEPLPSNHPYWLMDQVIVSPHNAYYSPKHMERNLDLFIENLKRLNEGLPLKNVINKEVGY